MKNFLGFILILTGCSSKPVNTLGFKIGTCHSKYSDIYKVNEALDFGFVAKKISGEKEDNTRYYISKKETYKYEQVDCSVFEDSVKAN